MANVTRREKGGVSILALKGSFFGDTETDDLMRAFNSLVADNNRRLIVDFSECDAMNSLAISVLARAHADYTHRRGEIKLSGLGKRIKSTFVMTKLILEFDHHDTVDQAVEAFGS
jgi:anti-anti-sigma factor